MADGDVQKMKNTVTKINVWVRRVPFAEKERRDELKGAFNDCFPEGCERSFER